MINLMIGTNYDPILPERFNSLNKIYKTFYARPQISEVYGSIQKIKIFGSARPDFRLPDISIQEFERQVSEYNSFNIDVNYTENTPIIDKSKLDIPLIVDILDFLRQVGIKRLTLAHPLAMEIVCKYSDIPIEVSTIYAVKNLYQIKELKKRYPNINKICADVDSNRDFKTLSEFVNCGVTIELLANEFCLHDCIDRVQCYNEHSQTKTELESSRFNRYPMGNCIKARMDPVEWLRARFILPQWLDWYNIYTKINHFKITGRTHPTNYIIWIAEEYLKGNYQGNLLQLWADVKNIKRVSKGQDHLTPTFNISCENINSNLLWKYWEDKKMLDKDFEYNTLKSLI